MRSGLTWLNVALRGVMEFGVIAAFALWGYHAGATTLGKIALALGAPLVGFGFWGAVDFRQAGRYAEPLRLIQELATCALAVWAAYTIGQHALATFLGIIAIVHHGLVYALGQRLLKHS